MGCNIKDGSKVEISIGDEEGDSVFCVTDLLPLSGKTKTKLLKKV